MKKQKNALTLRALLICCFALTLLAGCSQGVKIPEDQSDTELFQHAKTLYEQGNYETALEYFLHVKEHFLRSSYAGLTRFYAGQCYFALEVYDEATIEYKSFLAFFPSDPNAPEAQFKLGASLFELALGPEQDQTTIQESFSELQKVAEKYPESEEFVRKSETLLAKVKERIAAYELQVARFYQKQERYNASNNRLQFLMKHYPETSVYNDALLMMAQNYFGLEKPEKANETLAEWLRKNPEVEGAKETLEQLEQLETLEPSPKPESAGVSQSIPEGYVVVLGDEQVFINLIGEDGVQEGMLLEVLRDEQPIGTLRVIEVQEGFSVCAIESLKRDVTIREDDKVRMIEQ